MSEVPKTPVEESHDERRLRELRDVNQALLASSVRQHELTEQADKSRADAEWARDRAEHLAEALRESEKRYRTLFESIDEGFCVIEFFDGPHGPLSDYVHIEANPAYATNAGISDIVGQKVREMAPDEAEGWVDIYRNVLVTGEPVRFERELVATGRYLELAAFRVEPAERRQVAVLFKDVTERKRAEQALRENEARLADELAAMKRVKSHFRQLFESAPGAYLVLDPQEYEIVAASDAYLKATMTERNAIVGRKVFEVFPDDPHYPGAASVRALSASFARVKETRVADAMGVLFYPIRRPDGQWEDHWWSPVNSPVLGPQGELTYIIHRGEKVTAFIQEHQANGTLTEGVRTLETRQQQLEADIALRAHELHRANEQLRASQAATQRAREYAESTLRTSPVPLLVLESNLRVVSANEAFYQRFKVDPSDTEGRVVYDVGSRQWDIPELRRLLEEVLPLHRAFEQFEVTHRFESIGRRTMLLNGRRMEVEAGGPERIVLVVEDITERKQAEEALRRTEVLYRGLAANLPQAAAFVVDHQLRYVLAEGHALRAAGFEPADFEGKTLTEALPAELAAEYEPLYRNALAGQSFRSEHAAHGRYFVSHGGPLTDRSGRVTSALVVSYDITDRKQMEQSLQEADRCKDEFLATLAHELRNPLAPLANSLAVIKDVQGSPEAFDRTVQVMQRQLEHMVRLIDDLLDVSRISRGKIELRRERVSLVEVLQQALETSRPLIEASGHNLRTHLPSEPLAVDGDAVRLAQVFANLLNNAAKYTESRGRIELNVERQGSDAVVTVADTGAGIPADMLAKIFEMFTQVEGSLGQSQGGLGIGLMLVKRLCELHGGSVVAQSAGPGLGSKFIVRLPLAIDAVPAKIDEEGRPSGASAQSSAAKLQRILVVDDNRDSAQTLSTLLSINGFEVHTAYDGQEAVEATSRFAPDAVLLDIGLPKLDGYEAARRIRLDKKHTHTVLIALTGWGQHEDRRRSAEAGFDAHIVKPVSSKELLSLLGDLPGE